MNPDQSSYHTLFSSWSLYLIKNNHTSSWVEFLKTQSTTVLIKYCRYVLIDRDHTHIDDDVKFELKHRSDISKELQLEVLLFTS